MLSTNKRFDLVKPMKFKKHLFTSIFMAMVLILTIMVAATFISSNPPMMRALSSED